MNGAFLRFGQAAVEMEIYARAALLRELSPDERAMIIALLRHARGVNAIVAKGQKKPTIAPE